MKRRLWMVSATLALAGCDDSTDLDTLYGPIIYDGFPDESAGTNDPDYGLAVRVMDAARGAGATTVGILTETAK